MRSERDVPSRRSKWLGSRIARIIDRNSCPAANNTISFEPVYARLAAAPDWKPTGGTLPGTVYALPTLIRVYTGDRITSTDLTDLHVSIDGGRAWLPALCLS